MVHEVFAATADEVFVCAIGGGAICCECEYVGIGSRCPVNIQLIIRRSCEKEAMRSKNITRRNFVIMISVSGWSP